LILRLMSLALAILYKFQFFVIPHLMRDPG